MDHCNISESTVAPELGTAVEAVYAGMLGSLWVELEDLLDAYCAGDDLARIRLKYAEFQVLVMQMLGRVSIDARFGAAPTLDAVRQRAFGGDLLRLLDADASADSFELCCGTTMVLAQKRILDEARRINRVR